MEFKAQDHPDYWLHASMKKRCYCKTNKAFSSYGGRGIIVCERWLMPRGIGFRNFVADMGPRPAGMTLERRENDKDYCPENCIWATMKDQGNNRRNNIRLTLDGVTKTATQWAHAIGLRGGDIIMKRIANGIPLSDALTIARLQIDPSRAGKMIDAAAAARRARTHCKRGHEFTEENVTVRNGTRTCKKCKHLRYIEGRMKQSAAYNKKALTGRASQEN